MTKKGQLTIFIIIGLVLLVAASIFLYLSREKAGPVEAARIRIAEVPVEARPVSEFVTSCLYLAAKEGLQKLGERGGYINPRQRYNPAQPTEGSAVQFAPYSKIRVPYWWHLSSNNACVTGCEFGSERPQLEDIESQLNDYIKARLPDCFGNFEEFSRQEVRVALEGKIAPKAQVTKSNVVVQLSCPLKVETGGRVFDLKDFVAELPVNFYEIYTLGTNITVLEAEHAFLERATRALIDIFGRATPGALPPVSEMEFGFGKGVTWTKYDVEKKIAQMLASYIPLLKVTYTGNYRYLVAPLGTNKKMYEVLYNRGFTVPVLEPHKSLTVKFVYLPWWKPYFDLNCNGQLCQPEGFSSTFGFLFGVRRYNFAYDLSYPVLVEITSPSAYGGEGYTLRFFLEANLRNNEPLSKLGPQLIVPSLEEKNSMLCDQLQRTSGNITIRVRTSAGAPVDNAEVVYACGRETCGIGTTENGLLVEKLPRCIGGVISAIHENYAPAAMLLDITDAADRSVDLVMAVPYPVDFRVKKMLLRKEIGTFGSGTWELDQSRVVNQGPTENTMIMLERKPLAAEEQVTIMSDVCGSPAAKAKIPCGDPPTDTSKGVNMYSGDYHVTIYSFNYPSPDLIIPPDKRCFSQGFGRRKCVWVPEEPIVFSKEKPYISGYAEFDWTITEDELKSAKAIEFTYLNFALDKLIPASNRKIEDLDVMGELFGYAGQYKDLLSPMVIK
ncbi:MAG: hypothetical protein QXM31_02740 [Candidatus Woesearchaeota archaeon]